MNRLEISQSVPREVREAMEDLLKEGLLVAVTELDPATGKLRNRYYHRDYAPKGN